MVGMEETTAGPVGAGFDPGAEPGFDPQRLRTVLALRRPVDDRMLAGVCTGLARYLRLDPVVVRVLIAALAIVGGLGVILYGTIWLLTPEEGSDRAPLGRVEDLATGPTRPVVLICAGLLAVAAVVGPGVLWWQPWPVLVVVGLAAWLLLRDRGPRGDVPAAPPTYPPTAPPEAPTTAPTTAPTPAPTAASSAAPPAAPPAPSTQTPSSPTTTVPLPGESLPPAGPPPPPAGPDDFPPRLPPTPRQRRKDGGRLTMLGLGLVAIIIAGAWIADAAGNQVEPAFVAAAALGVVGACLLVGTWAGNARPLVFPALVLGAALAVTSVTPAWSIGERRVAPLTAAAVDDSYEFGVGRQVIDLGDVSDVDALDGRIITVETGVGETVVVVPDGMDVSVSASVEYGELVVFGERVDHGTDNSYDAAVPNTAAPDLRLVVDNTIGRIEVERS